MSNLIKSEIQPLNKVWNYDQLQIVKNTIGRGLSDDELTVFAHMCARTQLDPFAKQIYPLKHGGRLTTIIGIDGFRLLAERTGKYAPGKDTEFAYNEGKLIGAKVFVKKLTPDGTWHEVSATAYLDEYNKKSGNWITMPHVMLEKCGEARALRRAFPADFSGLYTKEEMERVIDVEEASQSKEEASQPDIITEEEYDDLWHYLQHSEQLQYRISKYMKEKYGHEDFRKLPKSLYEHSLMRAEQEYNEIQKQKYEEVLNAG